MLYCYDWLKAPGWGLGRLWSRARVEGEGRSRTILGDLLEVMAAGDPEAWSPGGAFFRQEVASWEPARMVAAPEPEQEAGQYLLEVVSCVVRHGESETDAAEAWGLIRLAQACLASAGSQTPLLEGLDKSEQDTGPVRTHVVFHAIVAKFFSFRPFILSFFSLLRPPPSSAKGMRPVSQPCINRSVTLAPFPLRSFTFSWRTPPHRPLLWPRSVASPSFFCLLSTSSFS